MIDLLSYYLWAGFGLAFLLVCKNGIPKYPLLAILCCLLLWPVILAAQPFLPKRLLTNLRP